MQIWNEQECPGVSCYGHVELKWESEILFRWLVYVFDRFENDGISSFLYNIIDLTSSLLLSLFLDLITNSSIVHDQIIIITSF